jgi:hypothetical protein
MCANSRCQLSGREIVLRRDTEGIGNPIEKCEHRGDVNRLGNLIFFPPRVTELLHIFRSGLVGSVRNQFYIFQ